MDLRERLEKLTAHEDFSALEVAQYEQMVFNGNLFVVSADGVNSTYEPSSSLADISKSIALLDSDLFAYPVVYQEGDSLFALQRSSSSPLRASFFEYVGTLNTVAFGEVGDDGFQNVQLLSAQGGYFLPAKQVQGLCAYESFSHGSGRKDDFYFVSRTNEVLQAIMSYCASFKEESPLPHDVVELPDETELLLDSVSR